jgi:hypothetical protein
MPSDPTRVAQEKRWRAEMEKLGRDVVSQRFTNRQAIIDLMPYPEADFVRKWLDEQERKAKFWPTFVTLLTVLLAGIAAWPVIQGWITK